MRRKIIEAARWRLRILMLLTRRLPAWVVAWVAFRRRRHAYRIIDETALLATRRHDTVFIFGSGYSLNGISPDEWRAIEAHDTIGFNWFVRQSFVRCDYQFVREILANDLDDNWLAIMREYFDLIRTNPRYADTVFMVQTGFLAANGNRALGYDLLQKGNPVYLWRTQTNHGLPSRSLRAGLTHTRGSLTECINFAALMSWRHIVLVGVDLYDRRYFWLDRDEPREGDTTVEETHKTASAGLVENIREWRDIYEPEGVHLYVYNPRSLLADVLPVWTWPQPKSQA